MRSLIALLCLVPVACGGGVSSDPTREPAPSGTTTPTSPTTPPPPPAPTAKSLLCSGATIQHEDDVAIWYIGNTEVTFVHHDGTTSAVHQSETDQTFMQAEVGAAGNRIGLLVHQPETQSRLYLFDRQSNLLASQTFSQDIYDLRVGEKEIAFSITVNQESEGRVWDGVNAPRSLGKWLPMAAPRTDGWVAVRNGWEPDAEYGFVDANGDFVSFPGKQGVPTGVQGWLVSVDKASRKLWIGSPTETKEISLVDFSEGDVDPPYISEHRSEGWISIRRQADPTAGDVMIVNAFTGESRVVPSDPGNGQPLAFYCNAGFPGYLASDGTLLRSRIQNDKLELHREDEPIGFPLSNIASLQLHERAGTVVAIGSDGSDTYCGSNEEWPAQPDTLTGDSVQIFRNGQAMLDEFSDSFNGPELDVSGSCTLLNQYDNGVSELRIGDLEAKTTRNLPVVAAGNWGRWLE